MMLSLILPCRRYSSLVVTVLDTDIYQQYQVSPSPGAPGIAIISADWLGDHYEYRIMAATWTAKDPLYAAGWFAAGPQAGTQGMSALGSSSALLHDHVTTGSVNAEGKARRTRCGLFTGRTHAEKSKVLRCRMCTWSEPPGGHTMLHIVAHTPATEQISRPPCPSCQWWIPR